MPESFLLAEHRKILAIKYSFLCYNKRLGNDKINNTVKPVTAVFNEYGGENMVKKIVLAVHPVQPSVQWAGP